MTDNIFAQHRAAQGLIHAGFHSGSFAATVHRELFEESVCLPRRETQVRPLNL